MVLTNDKTVGEIAAQNPSAVRVFERHQIDYCCGGSRSIDEVCQERGISAEQLRAELEAAATTEPARDWTTTPLEDLTSHIVSRHHAYLRAELPALEQRLAKVIEAHGSNHAASLVPLQQAFLGLKEELTSHMMKEEMVLFPLIQRMEAAEKAGAGLPAAHCGSVNNPIRVMEYEHDSAGRALEQMRSATSGYALPPEACNTYRALFQGLQELEADLHLHIHLENNILFPRALELEARLASRP